MRIPDPWPLRHLVLRTPRLELRPDDDAGLLELTERALEGIHPPDYMPFKTPWTQLPPEELSLNMTRFHWTQRAESVPGSWRVNFLIRLDGTVIGSQSVHARQFPVTRSISTGSWLGRKYQGRGFGAEMRAAVLMFAFDHLGATEARSAAYADNAPSNAVSAKLGYIADGTQRQPVSGRLATEVRLLLTPERFIRPTWELDVAGLDLCEAFLCPPEGQQKSD